MGNEYIGIATKFITPEQGKCIVEKVVEKSEDRLNEKIYVNKNLIISSLGAHLFELIMIIILVITS